MLEQKEELLLLPLLTCRKRQRLREPLWISESRYFTCCMIHLLHDLKSCQFWVGSRTREGIPAGSVVNNLLQWRSHRRCVFDPWVRKVSYRRKWQPTPVFSPGKSHGQRRLAGYSPKGRKELDTTEWLIMHARRTGESSATNSGWYDGVWCVGGKYRCWWRLWQPLPAESQCRPWRFGRKSRHSLKIITLLKKNYLFLVALGLYCCTQAFSSCNKQGYSSLWYTGFLSVASLVVGVVALGTWASVVAPRELSCSEAWGIFLDQEWNPCPLEKEMATCSIILAWRNPWTGEPDGLQPMGSHNWATNTVTFPCIGRWIASHRTTREVLITLLSRKSFRFSTGF